MKIIWIFGMGLLGRGLLAPTFYKDFLVHFFESDYSKAARFGRYPLILPDGYEWIEPIKVSHINSLNFQYTNEEPYLILTAVGTKNLEAVAKVLGAVLKRTTPLITFENDPSAYRRFDDVPVVKPYSGIADATIPYDPKMKDWYSGIVYCDPVGRILIEKDFLEDFPDLLPTSSRYSVESYDDFGVAWAEKFFVHLAPHALAAYLGILYEKDYIHEVYADEILYRKIQDAVRPLMEHLKVLNPTKDWQFLWDREVDRVSRADLPDSVWRVARNPKQKLGKLERLIKPLEIMLNGEKNVSEEAIPWLEAVLVASFLADIYPDFLKNIEGITVKELKIWKKMQEIEIPPWAKKFIA